MATAIVQVPCTDDDRLHSRVQYEADLAFETPSGQAGFARCMNISRAGFALRFGRFLRPGTKLTLQFADAERPEPIQIEAEIAWCQPDRGNATFSAGASIRRADASARTKIFSILHQATSPRVLSHSHAA